MSRRRLSKSSQIFCIATCFFLFSKLLPLLPGKGSEGVGTTEKGSTNGFTALCRMHNPNSSHRSHLRWNEYRIGDGISFQYDAPGCERFPGSIVCLYRKETRRPNDFGVLFNVLQKFSEHEVAEDHHADDVAFLHARLGDGLCAQHDPPCRGTQNTVPDCWNNNEDCFVNVDSETKQYAFTKEWYEPVTKELIAARISKIVIISDIFHWTRTPDPRHGDFSVDEAYLSNVANFFRNFGFEVCTKEPGLPDHDFALLSSARVFVQGGGGYSALISKIVSKRGGVVVKPNIAILDS